MPFMKWKLQDNNLQTEGAALLSAEWKVAADVWGIGSL